MKEQTKLRLTALAWKLFAIALLAAACLLGLSSCRVLYVKDCEVNIYTDMTKSKAKVATDSLTQSTNYVPVLMPWGRESTAGLQMLDKKQSK